jgi:hypothetical protein
MVARAGADADYLRGWSEHAAQQLDGDEIDAHERVHRRRRALRAKFTARVAELRAALVCALGGRCVDCGTATRLEFDHTVPRTWSARRCSSWTRVRIYQREAAEGLLCLRCRTCNARKGKPRAVAA